MPRHPASVFPKKSPRTQHCSSARRSAIILLIALTAGILAWKTYDLQFTQAERITAWGDEHRLRTTYTQGVRGNILDRSSEILATSFPGVNIFADPSLVKDPASEAALLAPILELDEESLVAQLSGSGQFVYLRQNVTSETAEQIANLELPGVASQESFRRHYPLAGAATEIVGRLGNYGEGLFGIEAIFNEEMVGTPGVITQEQYPGGRSIPGGFSQETAAIDGSDVRLSIDRLLQHEAARVLAEQVEETDALGGVILISVPRTGEILAMVSADRSKDGELITGYRNRALTWVFEPGSVMKALTFSAVLDSGLASPATVRNVPDQLWIHDSKFSDYNPHPPEDYSVHRILVESSNIGTIQWAQQLGQKELYDYLRMFGLGSSSGLGLEGESRGLLEHVDRWSGTSLPTIAIGQGVSVTPIQLLFAYNAIANNGYYVPPKLVEEVISPNGESTLTATPLMERQVVSEATSVQLRAILRDAVLQGTGKRAQIPNYEVAGKTGTARKPLPNIGYGEDESEYKYVATFAGFLPAAAPEISLLVVIDEPTSTIYGGTAAAPAFKEIAEIALRRLRIPPTQAQPAVVLASARNTDG